MTRGTDPAPSGEESPGVTSLIRRDPGRSVLGAPPDPAWRGVPGARQGVVWVTADGGADAAMTQLRHDGGSMPDSVDVLSLGDCMRSAAAGGTGGDGITATTIPFQPSDLTVHTVPASVGLDGLGSAMLDCIEEQERRGRVVAVVVEDLAPLLDHYGLETAFRFLHLMTARTGDLGGCLRIGVESSAVEDHALRTLAPLFDRVG